VGQPLAVVEAMKMQNILRAEKKAKVKAVPVKAGDTLATGAIIMEFE
jgi:propionyl-CoA carboxylase alpha chain